MLCPHCYPRTCCASPANCQITGPRSCALAVTRSICCALAVTRPSCCALAVIRPIVSSRCCALTALCVCKVGHPTRGEGTVFSIDTCASGLRVHVAYDNLEVSNLPPTAHRIVTPTESSMHSVNDTLAHTGSVLYFLPTGIPIVNTAEQTYYGSLNYYTY